MVIYWTIEVKKRELDARLFSTFLALQKNFKVVLGGKDSLYNNAHRCENGIFFLKSPHFADMKDYHNIISNGHRIVCNNEEGLMYFSPDNYLRTTNSSVLKLIDFYFCWGEYEKKTILTKYPNYKNKLLVTGNPRIDVLKKDYNILYKDEENKIKKEFGEYILLTTKFVRFNVVRRGWRTYYQGQKKAGYINNFNDKKFSILSENHERNNLRNYLNFIELFSKNYPNKKLLVKPHPVENIKKWVNICKGKKNVILIDNNKFNTNALIKCSDFLISYNCTTSLEAYLLNVPSINYIPYRCKLVEYNLPKLVSKNIYNLKNLNFFIKTFNKDTYKKKISFNNLRNLKKRIFNIDKINSIELMLNSFKKIIIKKNNSFQRMDKFNFYKIKLKKILLQFYFRYLSLNKEKKGTAVLSSKKFNYFSLSEVKERFNKICLLNKVTYTKFRITELYPGFILFENK